MSSDLDRARADVREALKHLFQVITDMLPQDLDKEERHSQAEYTLNNLVDAEIALVENLIA